MVRVSQKKIGLSILFALLLGMMGIVLTLFASSANAYPVQGFSPSVYPNKLQYGIGVYFTPYHTVVYEAPSEMAPVLEDFNWSPTNESLMLLSNVHQARFPAKRTFLSFYPTLNAAVMAVVSDNGKGWAEVVYDQTAGKTGWVRLREKVRTTDSSASSSISEKGPRQSEPAYFGQFQTWYDFMKLNGMANGIYWLTGVSQYQRSLRTSPEDKAKLIEIMVIRNLKLRHIRGNWMLVEILDFNRNTPIGWIRWRDKDGRLLVFPDFTGNSAPRFYQSL